jgi:hypothetical protein
MGWLDLATRGGAAALPVPRHFSGLQVLRSDVRNSPKDILYDKMKKEASSPPSGTDWDRVDRMKDEEIDFSDLPEIPPEKSAQALVRKGLKPAIRRAQISGTEVPE